VLQGAAFSLKDARDIFVRGLSNLLKTLRKQQASDSCPNNEDVEIFDGVGAHIDNFMMMVTRGLRALMIGKE
jgi:hypothetical protein